MKFSFIPYQYRRETRIPSETTAGVPREELSSYLHRPCRLGIGSASGNIKASHIVCGKKDSVLSHGRKELTPSAYLRLRSRGDNNNGGGDKAQKSGQSKTKGLHPPKATPGGDAGNNVTSRMKLLTIYESPKSSADYSTSTSSSKTPNGTEQKSASVTSKVFLNLNKKANYVAALNRKVSFTLSTGRTIQVQPKGPSEQNDEVEAAKSLSLACRHFRNILGWKLSIHMNWKYVDEKAKKWYTAEGPARVSLGEIAALQKVSVEDIENLNFGQDLEELFVQLRFNLCHVAFPNIARLVALQNIQVGNAEAASKYVSEQCGMYVHSEIVDKHLTFVRRNEELKGAEESDVRKTEIFLKHVDDTLTFSNDIFDKNGTQVFRDITTFHPDWNVIQISISVDYGNKFGYDAISKTAVPELLLSAFTSLPNYNTRSEFTTPCKAPRVEEGSQLRHGLMDAFERLLDKNLMISDDKIIISRRRYWEERGKHNATIESIMYIMEDWIFPWIFLLPGIIANKTIQNHISDVVLSHPSLENCTESQKLLIYRLTDCYSVLPARIQSALNYFVSIILQTNEKSSDDIASIIVGVGSQISVDEPRNPTILVLDQQVDILPWDWLPCLRTTNVTRMPSLNVIKSTINMLQYLGQGDMERVVDQSKCTFVLNPDGTLPQVQQRLETYLRERHFWVPVVARSPTSHEMQTALETQDLFLYCGHGAGSNFYPEYAVQKLICKAIPILMGCSSAQSHFSGPGLYSCSSIHAYLIAGCSSVVGFLWEVTDNECDRITVEFIERWLPHPPAKLPKMPLYDSESQREHDTSLCTAWRKSRTAATQLLTQCAAVCYGLPIVVASPIEGR